MRIVDERDAIRRPELRERGGIITLIDQRRRFLTIFYGMFVVLMMTGTILCVVSAQQGGDPLLVGVLFFGFMGGVMGYITLRCVARSCACRLYPQEQLVQFRRTWFGLCTARKWIDVSHAALIVEPARLRGTRITHNPLAWVVFVALIPLGVLGWLFGVAMERQVLIPGQALSVQSPQGHIEVVVVVAAKGDVAGEILKLFTTASAPK